MSCGLKNPEVLLESGPKTAEPHWRPVVCLKNSLATYWKPFKNLLKTTKHEPNSSFSEQIFLASKNFSQRSEKAGMFSFPNLILGSSFGNA